MNKQEDRAAQRQSEMAMFDDVWSGNERNERLVTSGKFCPHNGYSTFEYRKVVDRIAGAENVFVVFSEAFEDGYRAHFESH